MEISERIQLLIEKHRLSASSFADRIGIQRSGLSHLFSGRNKPSLDLIMKIIEAFPDTSVEWLLWGKGSLDLPDISFQTDEPTTRMLHTDVTTINSDRSKQAKSSNIDDKEVTNVTNVLNDPISITVVDDQKQKPSEASPEIEEKINRLILVYTDGTFTTHNQRET
jgi:transcriptional regulator with XRE-family HTH domain